MHNGFVIAIDGPVATGKGTLAHTLAEKLYALDLWTGATYRGLAFYCIEQKIDLKNQQAVIAALPQISFQFSEGKVLLNGRDVTEKITTPEVAAGSAIVSSIPEVRKHMVQVQQQIAKQILQTGKIVVAEGRDTATRVFPDAAMKIYLTAQEEIRAQRRLKQLQKKGNDTMTLEQTIEETKLRDKRDMERETDPLQKNPEDLGYFILDNSKLSREETVETIIQELKKRGLLHD